MTQAPDSPAAAAAPSPRRVRAVFLDIGETIIDETRVQHAWADWLGVPRHTFAAVFGGTIAAGNHPLAAGMVAVHLRRGPWGYLVAGHPDAARAHLRIDSLAELPAALRTLGPGPAR